MRHSPSRRQTSPWADARRRRLLLNALPKTDLHVHLDGSIRPGTILALAREQGVRLPVRTHLDLKRFISSLTSGVSLPRYLKAFDLTLRVLQEREALERAAFELAEDAHAENVRYMEVRYCPALHTRQGLTMDDTVEAVTAGLTRARHRYGIQTGTIVCGIRHLSPRLSLRLAELAVEHYGRGVVGFDLAGAEKDYPAKAHRRAFDHVVQNNVNVTVHAGEAFGAESIAQALHYCGAHRIGHGTRLREDRAIFDYVNDHRIPLEMCITSNVHTRAVPRAASHPLRRYLEQGAVVTINTDGRLIDDVTLTDEYYLAHTVLGLGKEDLARVVLNACEQAFLPEYERVALVARVQSEMDKLE